MDGNGARILSQRIAQQQNWEQADAVRDGRQPRTDPHLAELESFDGALRLYGPQRSPEQVNGHVRFFNSRLVKELRDGEWVVGFERDESPSYGQEPRAQAG